MNNTNLPNNLISTVAGNGSNAYGGDGGQATNASLWHPSGSLLDAAGNLYIADQINNRIRKVGTNGIITTVAGNGVSNYTGDGGAATNASLSDPSGVALDAAGNLYVADYYNNRIRKVSTNGIITTVAGTNAPGYSGDGGAAMVARIQRPTELVFDATGNLYIADSGNNRIRRVDANGVITTVAGGGSGGNGEAATNASLSYPTGLGFDAAGNLYIADTDDHLVREVATNGIITTVAGNGSATYAGDGGTAVNASLNSPTGVTIDAGGYLYVVDSGNNRLRQVDPHGIISTVAGNGLGTYAGDGGAPANASLQHPFGVTQDSLGNPYIADAFNGRIRKALLYAGHPTFTLSQITPASAGNYSVIISSASGSVTSTVASLTVVFPPLITSQPASQIALAGSSPSFSVTVTGTGPFGYAWYYGGTNLVQSGTNSTLALSGITTNNAGNYTVVVSNAYTSVVSQVAGLQVALPPSVTLQPRSQTNVAGTAVAFNVTAAGTGPFTYQWQFNGTNLPNDLITTVAGNGSQTYAGDGGPAINASLNYPEGLAFDPAGNLYISDTDNNRVRKVDTNGIITTVTGNGSATFAGDGGVATNASLDQPVGLVLDATGTLYVADSFNNCIRQVNAGGIITTAVGTNTLGNSGDGGAATSARLDHPTGVTRDAAGNLYVADSGNCRVRKVNSSGVISTAAGKDQESFTGDGGAATNASLNLPNGVALDPIGNLYVADSNNNRIRKVDTNGIITTVAGGGNGGDGGAATNTSMHQPFATVVDSAGNLYVADTGNSCIHRVDTNGTITIVAGGGSGGDGIPATNASLSFPFGVTLDTAGNLYIADTHNNRIRKVCFAGSPTFTLTNLGAADAGNYSVVITSPYGSVTSSVVSLTVVIPPQIITTNGSFGVLTNQFGFSLTGPTGQPIIVDGSTDMVNWIPLFTNIASASPFYFFDPVWTNFPSRFYRARMP